MGGHGGGACGAGVWDGAIVRVKIYSFGDTFDTGTQNVYVATSIVVRGGSEVPPIETVGGPGVAVAGCFMDNNAGAGRC